MLLQINNLKTYFRVGLKEVAKAVDGISFQLEYGKTLALVGESGCGKTQTAFSIIRLISENGFHPSGEILFDGKDLTQKSYDAMRKIRGNDISMIFQEPMTSLNPLYRVGNQLKEPLQIHQNLKKSSLRKKVLDLLNLVGIPDPDKRINSYPHELSGGMKQRIMIAMALACEPKLLIADEPTTALDVTIQAQVLKLMTDLQKKTGMAILLITHDLGIVNQMADDICILYAGRIAERGNCDQILKESVHPYTRKLLESIPNPDEEANYLNTIPGLVPSATDYGDGCLFLDRCQHTFELCRSKESPLHKVKPSHFAACHLIEFPDKAKTEETKKRTIPAKNVKSKNLIIVKNLKTWFPVRGGVFRRISAYIKAVDGVDLEIKRGSTLGLAGESGCGKTTLGESILRLNRETKGEVLYKQKNILTLNNRSLKKIRRHLQAVFQDPYGALSPRMTILEIIGEGLRVFQPKITESDQRIKVEAVLMEVGLSPNIIDRYPHEFSGGQRQRISIARALILSPEFILLDEPTSALDISVQAQVLNLLRDLQFKHHLTYMFITHNLSAIRYLADVVAIMYLGRIVEYAPVKELFNNPKHPYTISLLEAIPSLNKRKPFTELIGDVPSPLSPPKGCHFHPRCNIFLKEPKTSPLRIKCLNKYPEPKYKGSETYVRCHAAEI